MDGEEWAEEAEGFFTEFAANTTNQQSKRKRNREADATEHGKRNGFSSDNAATRKLSADEARRRIAAAVVGRASSREVERAAKMAKKERRDNFTKGSSNATRGTASGDNNNNNNSDEGQSISGNGLTPAAGLGRVTLNKKNAKVDEKFARKEQRKEEARMNAIKYKKVLSKRR